MQINGKQRKKIHAKVFMRSLCVRVKVCPMPSLNKVSYLYNIQQQQQYNITFFYIVTELRLKS